MTKIEQLQGHDAFLIYPPFADPTWAYVSLPTLKGYLAQRRIGVTVQDYNVEAWQFLLAPENTKAWQDRLNLRFAELNDRKRLTLYEQMEYWRVVEALPLCRDFSADLATLRDPEKFYRKKQYGAARNGLETLFRVMEAVCFPFRFSCNRADHLVAPWDFSLLDYYISGQRSPLDSFYRRKLTGLGEPKFIGISLTFVSQIPETFYLCRLIRQMFPNCFVMLGGPCIDQIVRQSEPATVARILDFVDAIGLQEGEKTLEALLPLLAAPDRSAAALGRIPNIVTRDEKGSVVQGPLATLDLAESARPDYSDIDLDRYLAPSCLLLYSPTRGCYWNKCSFCAYGFNQSGHHRYREIPVERAVDDLAALHRQFGVTNFYLSADVLAPAYALALAERIIDQGLALRWSTDLRIEPFYTRERCRRLYEGGLRAVAFGIESGSDRVLGMMHKGVSVELIKHINRNFHEAGISTSWMTFLGHPGETGTEADETLSLIERQSDRIDQFITGEFNLTPGSLISCAPQKFGLDAVYHARGDIFRLFPIFVLDNENTGDDRLRLEEKIDRLSQRYHLDHYPWAGAISTHHSFLFLLHDGPRVFAQPWPRPAGNKRRRTEALPAPLRFSPAACRRREESFMAAYLDKALEPTEHSRFAPLSFDHFQRAVIDVKLR